MQYQWNDSMLFASWYVDVPDDNEHRDNTQLVNFRFKTPEGRRACVGVTPYIIRHLLIKRETILYDLKKKNLLEILTKISLEQDRESWVNVITILARL